MEKDIIYLDLGTNVLYGWEDEKSDLVIDAIVRGIEAGDEFPAVPVSELLDESYFLRRGRDGGHCRAVGHYIAGKPLKCKLVPLGYDLPCTSSRDDILWSYAFIDYIQITEILIVDDEEMWNKHKDCYDLRRRYGASYR